jgi:flagellar protein FlgJ
MSIPSTGTSAVNPNVFDVGSLTALKRQVKNGDPTALKAAARQFESLFLQMVLKSMRDATPREGLFDSEQSRMYESLLNQEPQAFEGPIPLSPSVPSIPLQRERMIPLSATGMQRMPAALGPPPGAAPLLPSIPLPAVVGDPAAAAAGPLKSVREFAARLWPAATEAGRATGIPAHFMVAQAALETGWGKSEPRRADGSPSFNVFGIKAGRNWQGPVVEATTTEYVDGVAQKQTERFRAYGSYAEAFRDYSSLLSGNARYAGVLGTQDATSFARGLQRAGFATDPMYAAKLERIIGGSTLRQVLAG